MIYYSEAAFEDLARRAYVKFEETLRIAAPIAVPIEEMIEQVYGLNMMYLNIRNNGRILGETVFEDTLVPIYDKDKSEYIIMEIPADTIIIEERLLEPRYVGRYRFTCAHELSHHILHKELYLKDSNIAALDKVTLSSRTNNDIETQANMLATCILMPIAKVKHAFYKSRQSDVKETVRVLADMFMVSKQAMEIRLRNHRLI